MKGAEPAFIAIGASGSEGLDDIVELLQALAKPCPAVVMVVLHRPSDRISHLQEVLARRCGMPVAVAEEAETLVAGTCYIGEPDGHISLVDHHIAHLVPGAGHRLRNRTVDTLFNSLAEHAPTRTIAVVLSGALDDGSRGMAAIHARGGVTMVLEPGAKDRGMQRNAIEYDGPIDLVGTARDIARGIESVLSLARAS